MRHIAVFLAFLLLCGGFSPARAEDSPKPPVAFKGHYEFSWGGIPVGTMNVTLWQDKERYAARATTKSSGIVRWFARHKAVSTVEGKIVQGRYLPLHYHSEYTLRKKSNTVDIAFTEDGNIKAVTLTPALRRDARPEITKEALRHALDPVTSYLALGDAIATANAQGKTETSFDMFDGKRLSRLTLTLKGTTQATLTRTPLGGFRKKELDEAKEEPAVDIRITRGDMPVLSKLAIPVYSGTLAGALEKHCRGEKACSAY